MCACAFLCFKMFSVIFPNVAKKKKTKPLYIKTMNTEFLGVLNI